jgi:hypothetical protein
MWLSLEEPSSAQKGLQRKGDLLITKLRVLHQSDSLQYQPNRKIYSAWSKLINADHAP